MTEVKGRLRPGRAFEATDVADLTDVPADVSWGEDGCLVVSFAEDIPEGVAAAVERRIVSDTPREEQVRADAEEFLAIPAPDLTELQAQVTRLTELVLGKQAATQ